MKPSNHFVLEEPRDDLLDVLRMIVMPGIHEYECLRPRGSCQEKGHAPIGDVGMVKRWLERLIFNEQPLARPERCVHFFQSFFKIANSTANALRPRIIRTVRKPRRDIPATQRFGNGHTIDNVVQGFPPNRCVRISQGSILVILVLKHIRIDRTRFDSMLVGKVFDFASVLQSAGKVPLNVQGQSRAGARQRMHVRGITEFFFDGAGGSELDELAESRASIRKAPRRQLDPEIIERLPNQLDLLSPHCDLKLSRQTNCSPMEFSQTAFRFRTSSNDGAVNSSAHCATAEAATPVLSFQPPCRVAI